MKRCQPLVGLVLREFLLWGVFVGICVGIVAVPSDTLLSHWDGQARLVGKTLEPPALGVGELLGSAVDDLVKKRLTWGSQAFFRHSGGSRPEAGLTLRREFGVPGVGRSLVGLGIRLQV